MNFRRACLTLTLCAGCAWTVAADDPKVERKQRANGCRAADYSADPGSFRGNAGKSLRRQQAS